MKLSAILAATALIATLGVSTSASAQDYRRDARYEQSDRRDYVDYRTDRADHRRDYRDYRHGNGRRYGVNWHRRNCHAEYRHHHRVTVCYR